MGREGEEDAGRGIEFARMSVWSVWALHTACQIGDRGATDMDLTFFPLLIWRKREIQFGGKWK